MSQFLRNDFSAIPDELKALVRWVNWRSVERDGKPTKVPIDPKDGRIASCSDPGTWGTFKDALARLSSDSVDGIGFQLGSPYTGIDLDHCRNRKTKKIEPWARAIIWQLNSYTEVSPTGTGVHIIVKGVLPTRGRRKGLVEMYSSGRYLTMTGLHLDGTPVGIEERQAALDDLHA